MTSDKTKPYYPVFIDLEGKKALVTGGSKGIGKAITVALAEAGADIAVVSRTDQQDIREAVTGLGRRYLHYEADLTERKQTREVVPAVAEEMGNVNILVNNYEQKGFLDKRGGNQCLHYVYFDPVF